MNTPKKKHLDAVSVTVWIPSTLVAEIDQFLARQTAGRLGVRTSRQELLRQAVRELIGKAPAEQVVP